MRHIKYWPGCIALLAVLLMVSVSACSPTSGTPSGSNLTVATVLQNSANAMKNLKTAHIDLKITGQAATSSTSSGSTTPSNVSFNVTGTGDEQLPDQESLKITTGSTNLAEIVLGSKVYIQNTKGQWYVLDKSSLQGTAGNPFSGIDVSSMNNLLAFAEHAQLNDDGIQSLNGENLRHINIVLDKEGLKALLNQNGQLAGVIGQKNVNTIIDSTKNFKSSLDLWIDETHFYIHRTELKLNVDANLTALQTPVATATVTVPSNVNTSIDSIIDLSKFNDPVTITPPTDAIPTTNPGVIFGVSQ